MAEKSIGRMKDKRTPQMREAHLRGADSEARINSMNHLGGQSAADAQPGRSDYMKKPHEMLVAAVIELRSRTDWSKQRVLEQIATGADLSPGTIRTYLSEGVPDDRCDDVLYNGVDYAFRQSWDTPTVWAGAAVRRLRKKCGWTRDYLAAELDVAPSKVEEWEEGRGRPHVSLQRRLDEIWMAASQ